MNRQDRNNNYQEDGAQSTKHSSKAKVILERRKNRQPSNCAHHHAMIIGEMSEFRRNQRIILTTAILLAFGMIAQLAYIHQIKANIDTVTDTRKTAILELKGYMDAEEQKYEHNLGRKLDHHELDFKEYLNDRLEMHEATMDNKIMKMYLDGRAAEQAEHTSFRSIIEKHSENTHKIAIGTKK